MGMGRRAAGTGVATQQFALLVFAPLLIVAPRNQRVTFLASAVGAIAVIDGPFIILTSGRALRATVIGSGFSSSTGGTVLWETHIHGSVLFTLSRILPVLLAMGLAWWAVRRLGPRVLEPVPLISLIATALSLRLVLEENLFGYYFMAIMVTLIVLDIVNHRFRQHLVAWLLLYMLAFSPIPWGFASNGKQWGLTLRLALPIVIAIVATLFLVVDVVRRRFRLDLLVWPLLVVLIFTEIAWTAVPDRHSLPTWFWQIVLVPTAVALAIGPLISSARGRIEPESHQTTYQLEDADESTITEQQLPS